MPFCSTGITFVHGFSFLNEERDTPTMTKVVIFVAKSLKISNQISGPWPLIDKDDDDDDDDYNDDDDDFNALLRLMMMMMMMMMMIIMMTMMILTLF